MSTQYDIYVAGFETRPHMLNKENYVLWSSRLLCYAKSRPNGKLIYNSIMNGSYVRQMIPKPGDADREVPLNETFHEQTDEELIAKELKQVEGDDQAIYTILLGLPEDIYAVVDSYETAQEIWLRVQKMMKGSDIGIQEKKTKLYNEYERFTSSDEESIKSYYHHFSKLMNDFKRNKHFPEKIAINLKNGNVVAARVKRNANGNNGNQIRCYNYKGVGHLARNYTFDRMVVAVDFDEIEEVNANYILMANLQEASTSDTSNLQTELEHMKERFENCIIKKENEYAKLWNGWYKKCEECSYEKISYDKAYNDMQQKIERLQAQLGDHKGIYKDTSCVSDTLDSLSRKLENKNVELEFQIIPKVVETNDLSKPVTSNSVPTPTESHVVKNNKVIAPGMFRINPFKTSGEEKYVPNKPIKASVRTNSITVSQPHVITKKDVNFDTNGLSSTGVNITTKIEGHNLGAIQRMIGSLLRLRVVGSRIKKLK
nr:hypothetical protein [Tanacetum cinerariifolium]